MVGDTFEGDTVVRDTLRGDTGDVDTGGGYSRDREHREENWRGSKADMGRVFLGTGGGRGEEGKDWMDRELGKAGEDARRYFRDLGGSTGACSAARDECSAEERIR